MQKSLVLNVMLLLMLATQISANSYNDCYNSCFPKCKDETVKFLRWDCAPKCFVQCKLEALFRVIYKGPGEFNNCISRCAKSNCHKILDTDCLATCSKKCS